MHGNRRAVEADGPSPHAGLNKAFGRHDARGGAGGGGAGAGGERGGGGGGARGAGGGGPPRRGYASHVRLYLAPHLGRVLLAELSASQVQAMFTAIARKHAAAGQPVTAAT